MTPDTFGVVSLWSDVNPILVAVYHGPQSENHLLRPNEDCRWYAVSPIFSSLCQTVFAWKLLTAAVIVGSCMVLAKSPFTILLRDLSEESNTCHLSRDFSWISCQPLLDGFNYWYELNGFFLELYLVGVDWSSWNSFRTLKTVLSANIQMFYHFTILHMSHFQCGNLI